MAVGSVVIDLLMKTGSFVTDTERAERQLKKLKTTAQSSGGAFGSMRQSMTALAAPLKAIGAAFAAAFSAKEIIRMADEMQVMSGRVKMATQNSYEHTQAMRAIGDIAKNNYTSLSAVTDLYIANERSLSQLGKTQNEIVRFTENLSMAMRAGGGSAQSQAAALTQLGQALASGVLRGDEFNSVAEQAPMIMQLLADSLGMTVGELRAFAQEGKITADVLYNALGNEEVTQKLQQNLSNLPVTIGDAWQRLTNVIMQSAGAFNEASGLTGLLAEGLVWVSDIIDSANQSIDDFTADVSFAFSEFMIIVEELAIIVDSFLSDFGTSLGEVADYVLEFSDQWLSGTALWEQSFGEFVLNSLQEVQDLLNFLVGSASAIGAAYSALTDNLVNFFSNAWAKIKEGAAAALNTVIDGINKVKTTLGGDAIAHIQVTGSGGAKAAKDIMAEFHKAFQSGSQKFSFANNAKMRYADDVLLRKSEKVYKENSGVGESLYNKRENRVTGTKSTNKSGGASRKGGSRSSGRSGVSEEQKAWEKTQEAIARAKTTAEEYLRTMDENYARSLQAFGLGKREKEIADALNKITEDYQKKIFDLNAAYADKGRDEGYYKQLEIFQSTYDQALEKARNFYEQENQLRGNWQLGVASALKDYADNANNLYENIQGVATNALKGMEDALVSFVTTGKADFKSLADSIIKDLIRIFIQQQITGLFANALGGFFGGGGVKTVNTSGMTSWSLGNFATGGYVTGPGTGTSDSIPAMLSNGEYVINAKATRENFALLEAINSGRSPVYRASGGVVGASPSIRPMLPNSGGNVTVNITNKGGQQMTGTARTSTDNYGNMIIDVLLQDMNSNGRYHQQLKGVMGR